MTKQLRNIALAQPRMVLQLCVSKGIPIAFARAPDDARRPLRSGFGTGENCADQRWATLRNFNPFFYRWSTVWKMRLEGMFSVSSSIFPFLGNEWIWYSYICFSRTRESRSMQRLLLGIWDAVHRVKSHGDPCFFCTTGWERKHHGFQQRKNG